MTGTITTRERGVDFVVEWRIQNFSTLRKTDGAYYCSPSFSFGGERWDLGISPNGSRVKDSSGHVDLWLSKIHSDHSIRLSFSLSLKTAKGEKYKEEQGTKDFDDGVNWFHRSNRFVPRAELTALRSDLLPDDVLTVVCIMKGRSSAGSESHSASAAISTPVSDSAGCSSESGECRHCKGNFAAGVPSSHQRKCEQRPVKCPDCLEVVMLQKFLNEHECHLERPQAETKHERNSENRSVDASTQTEEDTERKHEGNSDNTSVNASTQTEEDSVSSLSENYKRMLLDGRHHDLILKVGDRELRAHRDVLRVQSRVFESMLDHDMKEGNTGVIDVPDCDPDAMELFLSYVYCGKIEALDHGNMLGLYYVADKYEMMELKRKCSDFIKKSLSHTNICSVVQLALNHSDSDLLECATEYFEDNVLDILQTVEWLFFLKNNLTVGNELFIKSIKKLKNVQT